VVYEVEIKEIGFDPHHQEPYMIADALIYADGQRTVYFEDISLKMTGVTRSDIDNFWTHRRSEAFPNGGPSTDGSMESGPLTAPQAPAVLDDPPLIYDREKILAFAVGNPSEAFGEPYRVFDRHRKVARLPGPPFCFIDGITRTDPQPWVLKADGWIEAIYHIEPDAWFIRADGTAAVPFSVLLEIALQPCGWLAAYMGSALRSDRDLKFRNLGGTAVQHRTLGQAATTLTMRSRLIKFSEAGEMIIEHFEFQVLEGAERVYTGETSFGFFSRAALANQVGLTGKHRDIYDLSGAEMARGRSTTLENIAPRNPQDPASVPVNGLTMPATALRMIDVVASFVPDGGRHGLGYIRGSKTVDPDEWFFKAHFHQDPVVPGSLGIESYLQLIRFAALNRWDHLASSHRFELLTGWEHQWIYRGQITPGNKKVEVEAVITDIRQGPHPEIRATGFLKVDGLYIYRMENFGYRLVPV